MNLVARRLTCSERRDLGFFVEKKFIKKRYKSKISISIIKVITFTTLIKLIKMLVIYM